MGNLSLHLHCLLKITTSVVTNYDNFFLLQITTKFLPIATAGITNYYKIITNYNSYYSKNGSDQ